MGNSAVLATVNFKPEGILGWIVVGLIAGYLAGHVMGDGGFGIIGDLVVGAVWSGSVGIIGSIVVAFVGACILIWLVRLMSGG